MTFYLVAFLLAYFQSSVLFAFFQSSLFAPNMVLAYLFLELMKEEGYGLKKALASGLFLDILQDSLGLHLFANTLLALLVNLLKERLDFPSRLSITLLYGAMALGERFITFFIFRLKYYTEFSLWLTLVGFFVEMLFFLTILRRYFKE